MPNPETDALHLVETFPVPAGKWFLPPTVRNDVGYGLQIFTPTGQHRGAVTSEGMNQRAKEGDQVLRVNLGTHELRASGTLNTKDGFTRAYSLVVVIRVIDPFGFAVLYRTNSDPVAQLRTAVDAQLQSWAENLTHDDIVESAMRFWANQAATLRSAQLGLKVERVERASVQPDPHYAELRAIQLEEEKRQAKHANEVTIAQEHRDETAKDKEAARVELEQDEQVKMEIARRQQITQVMVDAFNQRISEGLAEGIPLNDLVAQDPGLAAWMGQLTTPSRQAQLGPGSMSFPLTPQMINAANTADSAAQTTSGAAERKIPSLGVTLAPVALTSEQMYAAERMTIEVDRAYVIRQVDDQGPSAQSGLAVNDIIIQVADQRLQDIEVVAYMLGTATPGVPLKIFFFRDRAIYQLAPAPRSAP